MAVRLFQVDWIFFEIKRKKRAKNYILGVFGMKELEFIIRGKRAIVGLGKWSGTKKKFLKKCRLLTELWSKL